MKKSDLEILHMHLVANGTYVQKQIAEEHRDLASNFFYDSDGVTVYAQCSDGIVKIEHSKTTSINEDYDTDAEVGEAYLKQFGDCKYELVERDDSQILFKVTSKQPVWFGCRCQLVIRLKPWEADDPRCGKIVSTTWIK